MSVSFMSNALYSLENYLDDMSMETWMDLIPLLILFYFGLNTISSELMKNVSEAILGKEVEETNEIVTGSEMTIGESLVANYGKANDNFFKWMIIDHMLYKNDNVSMIAMAASVQNPALEENIVQRCTELWLNYGKDMWRETDTYIFSNIYFTRGGHEQRVRNRGTNDEVPEIKKLVHPNLHDSSVTFAMNKETKKLVWMEINAVIGEKPQFVEVSTFGPEDQLLLLTRTVEKDNKNIGVDVIFHDMRNVANNIRALWHKRFFFELNDFFTIKSTELINLATQRHGETEWDAYQRVVSEQLADQSKKEELDKYFDSWVNIRDYLKLVMIAGFHRYFMWQYSKGELKNTMLFSNTAPGGQSIDEMIQLFRNPIQKGKYKNPDNEHIDIQCSADDLSRGLCFRQATRSRRRRST